MLSSSIIKHYGVLLDYGLSIFRNSSSIKLRRKLKKAIKVTKCSAYREKVAAN